MYQASSLNIRRLLLRLFFQHSLPYFYGLKLGNNESRLCMYEKKKRAIKKAALQREPEPAQKVFRPTQKKNETVKAILGGLFALYGCYKFFTVGIPDFIGIFQGKPILNFSFFCYLLIYAIIVLPVIYVAYVITSKRTERVSRKAKKKWNRIWSWVAGVVVLGFLVSFFSICTYLEDQGYVRLYKKNDSRRTFPLYVKKEFLDRTTIHGIENKLPEALEVLSR